jgi:predicted nucleic acid-binding protein
MRLIYTGIYERRAIKNTMDCLIASYAIMTSMYLLHNDSDFTQIAGESKLKIYNMAK